MKSILVIIMIWVIGALIVNPVGDFPLNDDWQYGRVVQSIVEKGYLQFPGEVAVPLIAQALWGALFCLLFGFSFTALRFSTLILGLVGVLATYGFLEELKISRKVALIGALVLALNPLYFQLSNTFMTDIPFLAFAMLALYFFMRGMKRESNLELLIGTLFACLAALTRQIGVIITLSFGFAYIVKNGISKRSLVKASLPAVLVCGTLILYQGWLMFTGRLPVAYNCQIDYLFNPHLMGYYPFPIVYLFCYTGFITLLYLGLFLFPFLILFQNGWHKLSSRQKALGFLALLIFFVVVIGVLISGILRKQLMMLSGNVLNNFGYGPALLPGGSYRYLPVIPVTLRLYITVISVIGAALLLWYLFLGIRQLLQRPSKVRPVSDKWILALVLSSCVFYGVSICLAKSYHDRYQVFLLPLLVIIAAIVKRNVKLSTHRLFTIIGIIVIAVYGVFAIGATHDYLSWNRVRWKAARDLIEKARVPAGDINGGFEFGAWHAYSSQIRYVCDQRWWWGKNIKYKYLITFGPVNGYEEIKRYPYKRWIPLRQGNIYVLRKT